jgi:uncharacterized membrane protein
MAAPKQARAGDRSGRGPRGTDKGAGGTVSGSGTSRGGSGRAGGAGRAAGGSPAAKTAPAKTAPAKAVQTKAVQTKAVQTKAVQTKAQTRRARDRARARELAEQRATAEPVAAGPPRWLQYTSFALALGGLGISIYLTIEHFTGNTTLACSDKGVVNCGAVTTSSQAMVFGVLPVAVLGLAFYVFMVAATSPLAWRSRRREVSLARLASVVVGVGFILYLIYVELFQVGAICLWCTGVHVITFLLFGLVALTTAVWGLAPGADSRQAR